MLQKWPAGWNDEQIHQEICRNICADDLNVKIEPRRILFLRTSLRIISLGRRFSILMYLEPALGFVSKKSVLQKRQKRKPTLSWFIGSLYFENLTWIQKVFVLEPWPGSICHRGTWKLETKSDKKSRENKNCVASKGFWEVSTSNKSQWTTWIRFSLVFLGKSRFNPLVATSDSIFQHCLFGSEKFTEETNYG